MKINVAFCKIKTEYTSGLEESNSILSSVSSIKLLAKILSPWQVVERDTACKACSQNVS